MRRNRNWRAWSAGVARRQANDRAMAHVVRNRPLSLFELQVAALEAERREKLAVEAAEKTARERHLRALTKTFLGARRRCLDRNHKDYPNWGALGVRFEFSSPRAAAEWMLDNVGWRSVGMSIDRIDPWGNYAPGNLRWATAEEQANNKRARVPRPLGCETDVDA